MLASGMPTGSDGCWACVTLHFARFLFVMAVSAGLSQFALAQDLDVTQSNVLDFGMILDAEGSVTLGTGGFITADPSGIHLGGSVQSGVYVITGGANCEVGVDYTESETNFLKIYNFTSIPPDLGAVNLAADGTLTITLGASLDAKIEATVGFDKPLVHSIKVDYKGNCSGNSAEVFFNGLVDVMQALGLSETTELDFGRVVDRDGTITVDLSNSISSDPGGISLGGSIASGVYNCTGTPNTTVSVTLMGSTSAGLTIGNFTSSEPSLLTVSLGGTGSKNITLGADLTINSASASPGLDQPLSFTITVNYN